VALVGRWEKVTRVLRLLGGTAGATAVTSAAADKLGHPVGVEPMVTYVLGLVATAATFLSIRLPRDSWSQAERERRLGKRKKYDD
jgi:hypothetical protein